MYGYDISSYQVSHAWLQWYIYRHKIKTNSKLRSYHVAILHSKKVP